MIGLVAVYGYIGFWVVLLAADGIRRDRKAAREEVAHMGTR